MIRILTWNCAGAFRKKAGQLAAFAPHLAVIQECERPERLLFPPEFRPDTTAWFGDPGTAKGVGVFGFSGLRVEAAADVYDPTIRLDYCFAPLHWSRRVTRLWVGDFADWRPWSDHCPLFVEIDV
jgi:hypothetical protein